MRTADLPDTWHFLKLWLQRHLPEVLADLRPGCSEDELLALEAHFGLTLPEDFRTLYLLNDGQESGRRSRVWPSVPGVFYGLPLLPLSEIQAWWDVWHQLYEDEPEQDEWMERQVKPTGFINPAYVDPGRLPICVFHGSHLGLDLAPGCLGTRGQIISYGRDESVHRVLAPSLGAFLAWLLHELESGNFTVVRNPEAGVLFTTRTPGHEIFLDSLPILFGTEN